MAKKIVETFLQNGVLMKRYIDGSVEPMRVLNKAEAMGAAEEAEVTNTSKETVRIYPHDILAPVRRGQRGKPGVGVVGAKIKDNKLFLKLSNGKKINAGSILSDEALAVMSPTTSEYLTRTEAQEIVSTVAMMDEKIATAMDNLSGEEIARRLEDIEFEDDRLDYNALKNKPDIRRIIVSQGIDTSGGGPGTVTASNGLTAVGTDVQLGGQLTKDTVIDGNGQAYSLTFSAMDNFTWIDGTDWTVGGTNVQNITMKAEGSMSLGVDSLGFMEIKTPAVDAGTATPGQVLTLSLASGRVEFADLSGISVTNGIQDIGGAHGLGGELTQNTAISGVSGTYDMEWYELDKWYINAANSMEWFRLFGGETTKLLSSSTLDKTGNNGIEMYHDNGSGEFSYVTVYDSGASNPEAILGYQNGTPATVNNVVTANATGVTIEASGSAVDANNISVNSGTGIDINTAVGDTFTLNEGTSGSGGTAVNGYTLTLIDTLTGEAKWQPSPALPAATTAGDIAMYDGASYVVASPTKDKFTGVTGTNVVLSATPVVSTDAVIDVYKNGLLQEEGGTEDYTITGTTVTFTSALVASDKVTVKYFA